MPRYLQIIMFVVMTFSTAMNIWATVQERAATDKINDLFCIEALR